MSQKKFDELRQFKDDVFSACEGIDKRFAKLERTQEAQAELIEKLSEMQGVVVASTHLNNLEKDVRQIKKIFAGGFEGYELKNLRRLSKDMEGQFWDALEVLTNLEYRHNETGKTITYAKEKFRDFKDRLDIFERSLDKREKEIDERGD